MKKIEIKIRKETIVINGQKMDLFQVMNTLVFQEIWNNINDEQDKAIHSYYLQTGKLLLFRDDTSYLFKNNMKFLLMACVKWINEGKVCRDNTYRERWIKEIMNFMFTTGMYRWVLKTQKSYYSFIHKYVVLFGEEIPEPQTLYRANNLLETGKNLGCFWGDYEMAVEYQEHYGSMCFQMHLPKGTKVVSICDKRGWHYLVDMIHTLGEYGNRSNISCIVNNKLHRVA